MSEHTIITIGRQFGSGGHEIGEKLSVRLGIPLYDRRLVSMAAEEMGIRKEDAERVDESVLSMFVANYTVTPGLFMDYVNTVPYIPSFDEEVYRKETEIIQLLAEKDPCVIVGRCADYILKDRADCINVFICAEKEDRKQRIAQLYNLTDRKAAEKLRRTDRERRYYYELHTGQEWGSIHSHQMLLNSTFLGTDRIVEIIGMLYKEKSQG